MKEREEKELKSGRIEDKKRVHRKVLSSLAIVNFLEIHFSLSLSL